ncbi:MAG: hypothetical protein GY866_24970 [Proteobacteria bacterium]|nr:hypothetical protein [Pseudomonadota bacterium]
MTAKPVSDSQKPPRENPPDSPQKTPPDSPQKPPAESTQGPPKKNPQEVQAERYDLVKRILGRETFIDALNPEQVTRTYSVYERNPQKIVDALIEAFQQYCRKCIRETAWQEIKNELSHATIDEAEAMRTNTAEEWYDKIRKDPALEQLLVMLIFKNHFWDWVRFGLKDIFSAQRMQPGHEINSYLNARFHRLKKNKNIRTVGDLVISDITEIVNIFKSGVMEKKIKIFN